jgi:hypothetical protein
MGGSQAATGEDEFLQDLLGGARAVAKPGFEGAALDEVHSEEDLLPEGTDVMDGDDVRVGEASHGLGFADEASAVLLGVLTAHDFGMKELDGDAAIELVAVSGIDNTHAAGAQGPQDQVAIELGAFWEGCS